MDLEPPERPSRERSKGLKTEGGKRYQKMGGGAPRAPFPGRRRGAVWGGGQHRSNLPPGAAQGIGAAGGQCPPKPSERALPFCKAGEPRWQLLSFFL